MQITKAINFSSFQQWLKVAEHYDIDFLRYDDEPLPELSDPALRAVSYIVYDDMSKQYIVVWDTGSSPERKMAGHLKSFVGEYAEFITYVAQY